MSGAANNHHTHGLDLPSDIIRNIAPATALDFGPEQIVPPEDGWMDSAPEAAHPSVLGPNTDSSPREICISEAPDLCSGMGYEPRASGPIESDWAAIMEFTAVDIFQHSPFGDVLNSLKSLSLSGDFWLNYTRPVWDTDDEQKLQPTHHPLYSHCQ